jgi:hypothetical protein
VREGRTDEAGAVEGRERAPPPPPPPPPPREGAPREGGPRLLRAAPAPSAVGIATARWRGLVATVAPGTAARTAGCESAKGAAALATAAASAAASAAAATASSSPP